MNNDIGTLLRNFRNACDALCCSVDNVRQNFNQLADFEDEAAGFGFDIESARELVEDAKKILPILQSVQRDAEKAYATWDNIPQP